jgi:hypothetical protein
MFTMGTTPNKSEAKPVPSKPATATAPDIATAPVPDTLAVRLLTKGVPLEDVSKLLGHASIAVTEKYYAPWVASRKLHMDVLEPLLRTPDVKP